MNGDRDDSGDQDANDGLALTEKNSATIRAEEEVAERGTVETSTRVRSGAIPSSYGARGGFAPQADEGSGDDDGGDGNGI